MGNFIYNIAKGRLVELGLRANNADPADAGIALYWLNISGASDATLQDCATVSAVLATSGVAQSSSAISAELGILFSIVVNNSLDTANLRAGSGAGLGLSHFSTDPLTAGATVTDLLFAYDPAASANLPANQIPLMQLDFNAVGDGSKTLTPALSTASLPLAIIS